MKRVWQALTVLGTLVGVGTLGYHTIEDMIILDALYMTITTLSTVGFGEVHPLSHRGRAFTIGLILFGVSAMAWAAESMLKALLEDHIHMPGGGVVWNALLTALLTTTSSAAMGGWVYRLVVN